MSLLDTWFDAYVRAQIGPGLVSGLVYDLLFKALAAVLLAPMLAWLLVGLIETSGGPVITNEAIAAFLLSPAGLGFLLAAAAFALLTFHTELAGLIHIAAGASRGAAGRWLDALATALAALPRLLPLALRQAAILLLWLLPPIAAMGLVGMLLLSGHDINWYLAHRPPEFIAALVIGGLLVLAAGAMLLRLLVNWALAVPICLYEGRRAREALAESRARMRGQRLRGLLLLAGNLGLILLVAALLGWLLTVGIEAVLALAQTLAGQALLMAMGLMLLAVLALLTSFALMAATAIVIVHLYLSSQQLDGLPDAGWQQAARRARIPRWLPLLPLAALLIGALMLIHSQLEALKIGRDVRITAHRGSSRQAPENTLSALYQAISDGADAAEIDVQETADGVPVLFHDTDLMRVAGTPRRIREVALADLRRLDVGSHFSPAFANEPVPTLEEALLVAGPRLGLNIELKLHGQERQLVPRVVELVQAVRCFQHCIITSLSPEGLAQVRALDTDLRLGLIVTAALGDPVTLAQDPTLKLDLLSMQHGMVTPARIRANRAAGLETHVWTVNDPDTMAEMIDLGVDTIITDEPARLRRLLDTRARLSDTELLLLALSRRMKD
jgi:glycerophosphoryl diester phosphodiesterase